MRYNSEMNSESGETASRPMIYFALLRQMFFIRVMHIAISVLRLVFVITLKIKEIVLSANIRKLQTIRISNAHFFQKKIGIYKVLQTLFLFSKYMIDLKLKHFEIINYNSLENY